MRKKGIILGLCILTAGLFAGCGSQSQTAEENTKQETAESGRESTKDQPEDSPEAEDAEDTEKSAESSQEVSGTIKNFTGEYLSILDEEGETLEFDLGNGTLECENGVLTGDHVTVVYQGTPGDLGGEPASVLRLIDGEDEAEPPEETFTGIVTAISPNTITVQPDPENKEDSITFFTVGTDFQCEAGLGPDAEVTVVYRGELYRNNARNVKVLSVTNGEAAAGEQTESEEEVTEQAARIVDVEDSVMLVEFEDDPEKTYAFDCSEAQISLEYGLLEGSEVMLRWQKDEQEEDTQRETLGNTLGNTQSGDEPILLLAVSDKDSGVVNKQTGGFTVTGTVMAVSQNTLTLTSDDGAQLTFTTNSAEMDMSSDPRTGSYVTVVVEPNTRSNIYKALKISPAY